MDRNETIVTSATGGQKGKKLAQLSTLDPRALVALAEVSGLGAEKYAPHNFLKGYAWSLSFDAAQRHLLAFWAGENNDPESQQLHLAHAAWHCLTMLSFVDRGIGTDDRPPAEGAFVVPVEEPVAEGLEDLDTHRDGIAIDRDGDRWECEDGGFWFGAARGNDRHYPRRNAGDEVQSEGWPYVERKFSPLTWVEG